MYDQLDAALRVYVDRLLDHAATALWPERRKALEDFWVGIAKNDRQVQEQAVAALGIDLPQDTDPAEVVFRLVLTAYVARLAEPEVTNADQALIYCLSFSEDHTDLAEAWFDDHPERRPEGF